jgi:hypothetical protein
MLGPLLQAARRCNRLSFRPDGRRRVGAVGLIECRREVRRDERARERDGVTTRDAIAERYAPSDVVQPRAGQTPKAERSCSGLGARLPRRATLGERFLVLGVGNPRGEHARQIIDGDVCGDRALREHLRRMADLLA